MPPLKDHGFLARGRSLVLPRLPRILLHIVSKKETTEPLRGFEHGVKVHELWDPMGFPQKKSFKHSTAFSPETVSI